jgi:LysR family transcriptional regulator, glycine cleavage system transcriptional activator
MLSMQKDYRTTAPIRHHRVPNLHAIEVFAIAARYGTFTEAARALGVTQSAVSRQVQQVEKSLGIRLFVRSKRGLELTAEGAALRPVIDEVLARLENTCDGLRKVTQVLTLRMPPTIATRWFLPLLPTLCAVLPDVDVRITTFDSKTGRQLIATGQPNFEEDDVDAAILLGRGDWGEVESIALMPELLTPVCSPARACQLSAPADLGVVPLLHCESIVGWTQWLDAAGVKGIATHRGQTFDTLEFALSAATRGQGVALGDLNLVGESIRDGVLVAPFDLVLDQGFSYHLVYPANRCNMPKIRAFREWLVSAAVAGRVLPEAWRIRSVRSRLNGQEQ